MSASSQERVFVALGSNIEPRAAHIQSALSCLRASCGIELVATSTIRQTDPVGPVAQGRFLNAVAELRTVLDPSALLACLLKIEQQNGRDRSRESRWGPRTLDLDILLFGDRIVSLPHLTIPHPRLAERLFVLEPLAELAPDLTLPGGQHTVQQLMERLREAVEEARL